MSSGALTLSSTSLVCNLSLYLHVLLVLTQYLWYDSVFVSSLIVFPKTHTSLFMEHKSYPFLQNRIVNVLLSMQQQCSLPCLLIPNQSFDNYFRRVDSHCKLMKNENCSSCDYYYELQTGKYISNRPARQASQALLSILDKYT